MYVPFCANSAKMLKLIGRASTSCSMNSAKFNKVCRISGGIVLERKAVCKARTWKVYVHVCRYVDIRDVCMKILGVFLMSCRAKCVTWYHIKYESDTMGCDAMHVIELDRLLLCNVSFPFQSKDTEQLAAYYISHSASRISSLRHRCTTPTKSIHWVYELLHHLLLLLLVLLLPISSFCISSLPTLLFPESSYSTSPSSVLLFSSPPISPSPLPLLSPLILLPLISLLSPIFCTHQTILILLWQLMPARHKGCMEQIPRQRSIRLRQSRTAPQGWGGRFLKKVHVQST